MAALYKKANLNIKQDGTIHVISAGYQYDSGDGNVQVLDEVVRQAHPGGRAKDRDLMTSTINGNPYFIDIEVDHPGNGSPLTTEAFVTLVKANFAILRHKEWPVQQVLGHSEWTARKIDPFWDGSVRPMGIVRFATLQLLREDMARFKDVPDDHVHFAAIEWLAANGITKGINPPENDLYGPAQPVTRGQFATFLYRFARLRGDA